MKITSAQLREKYLRFFEQKGHAIIPGASLIPENDPTVLFTTAGMHPLVPYLMGQPHPKGRRLADVQKCVRTGDIEQVGDATHCTFFEMLGNWSLGDYFKRESISYSFEFLTKELGIDKSLLAVTVFKGDSDAPKDIESASIWQELGIPADKIFFMGKKDNWWGPAGITGPCGPDTEIFYDTGKRGCDKDCGPGCGCGRYVEIWNNVFMEYEKLEDGSFAPLKQKNVDTGMGLERTVAVLGGHESVYDIDIFTDVFAYLDKIAQGFGREKRIIADHIRTAVFILGDPRGVTPSNVDQGYVLRRLIRRAVRFYRAMDADFCKLAEIARIYINTYKGIYPELEQNADKILNELSLEIEKFNKTLAQGLKEFDKVVFYLKDGVLSGKTAFRLYDTYGFPIEITQELATERGISVDMEGYKSAMEAHQLKSQAGAEQKFKGGLQDDSEATTKLHTATHLLLAALKKVLGDNSISQRGSNITAERLRLDFNFPRPLTAEEIAAVEQYVNKAIADGVDVVCRQMSLEQALKEGAVGSFTDRYADIVNVYTIKGYSKEICGGPHAANTRELGSFSITKEQSSSSGVRRIRAILNGQN
jgi:alanyl-tRNA synthetase